MKNNTFKNLIITSIVALSLALLPGCGGGGGGGGNASGGFGYIPQQNVSNSNNEENPNSSPDESTYPDNSNDSPTPTPSVTPSPRQEEVEQESTLRKDYNYSISGKGETISITMDCNENWNINKSTLPSDVIVSPLSGNGTGETLTIIVPKNKSNVEQTIQIPLVNKTGTQISLVTIKQDLNKIKDWLFINYFACDNNLADFHLDSLNAMEKVGSDENTNIIAYYDLGNRTNLTNGKYEKIITEEEWAGGAREFYLIKDSTNKITSPVIKYYDDINIDSANPNILIDFILRAIEKYPAEKICITITDHGAAYIGAISDETNSSSGISTTYLSAIRYAMEKVYEKIGKKIDLLIFDDCVMSNFEVAYELKDTVSYILASEDLALVSILNGMNGAVNYYDFLSTTKGISKKSNILINDFDDLTSTTVSLSNQITKVQRRLKSRITSEYDGEKLAKEVLKANKDRRDKFVAGQYPFTNYNTCSIIDCSKCDSLKDAISDFANFVKTANATDKKAVKKATEDLIVAYEKLSDIQDTYDNLQPYYGTVKSTEKQYIAYKPIGEIHAPFYMINQVNRTSYMFSASEYSIADLGLIMKRIYSPSEVYETVATEISSASSSLKVKAEAVYNALKEVVPDDYYYTTDKVSLAWYVDGVNYYAPFGYHKYSNGLSIGWFVYNTDGILKNWTGLAKNTELNKEKYTEPENLKFYEQCPEWITMQESL